MQIEPLKDIQEYLRRTADDLERVSLNLAGHMRYLQHTSRAKDAREVDEQIQGLQASAQGLRQVFKD